MNNKKRNCLKATLGITLFIALPKWQKPFINIAILPVHAQMSICMESDILGDWEFLVGRDFLFGITLNEDDSALINGDIDATWELNENNLSIEAVPPAPYTFTGTIMGSNCSSIEGTTQNNGEPFVGNKL